LGGVKRESTAPADAARSRLRDPVEDMDDLGDAVMVINVRVHELLDDYAARLYEIMPVHAIATQHEAFVAIE